MARPSLGGMLATRQGALILAVLCAACAAGVLLFALSHYKASVQQTKAPTPQATVLVSTGQIPKGLSGNVIAADKLYKSTPIVATELAPGAISDSAALAGKVAAADILPGQQLTLADFATTVGAAAVLSPTQRAISLPTDDIHGDLAVLEPGDRVDLYAEFTNKATGGLPVVSLLIPDVAVLKTPSSGLVGSAKPAAPAPGTPSSSALVLAISSPAISTLTLAADTGKLWVALRPANAAVPVGPVATVTSLAAMAAASESHLSPTPPNITTNTGSHP